MKWIKDPLVIFLLVGALIFYLASLSQDPAISYQVDVREQDIARISDQWAMQMRRPPNEVELAGLVEQFVKEEIYYREAQRIKLDRNDTIVRRRMVQKLTFLTEDLATAVPLDDPQLNEYYQANSEDYRQPERFSFRHRYFSADKRENAEADATSALQDADNAGDPFMLQRDYALRSQREIGDLFGREFATVLAQLGPDETWQGPIRSAYGWHAVLITDRVESRLLSFESVRDRVTIDARQAARTQANDDYFQGLKDRYDISYANPTVETPQ